MTEFDRERIMRIMEEATGDPSKGIPPKRIYSDDALFLIEMIWRLLQQLGDDP